MMPLRPALRCGLICRRNCSTTCLQQHPRRFAPNFNPNANMQDQKSTRSSVKLRARSTRPPRRSQSAMPLRRCTFAHVERADGGHRTKYARHAGGIAARICQGDRSVVGNDTQHHDAGGKTAPSFAGGGRSGDAAFHRLRQSTAQQILDFHRMPSRPAPRH